MFCHRSFCLSHEEEIWTMEQTPYMSLRTAAGRLTDSSGFPDLTTCILEVIFNNRWHICRPVYLLYSLLFKLRSQDKGITISHSVFIFSPNSPRLWSQFQSPWNCFIQVQKRWPMFKMKIKIWKKTLTYSVIFFFTSTTRVVLTLSLSSSLFSSPS